MKENRSANVLRCDSGFKSFANKSGLWSVVRDAWREHIVWKQRRQWTQTENSVLFLCAINIYTWVQRKYTRKKTITCIGPKHASASAKDSRSSHESLWAAPRVELLSGHHRSFPRSGSWSWSWRQRRVWITASPTGRDRWHGKIFALRRVQTVTLQPNNHQHLVVFPVFQVKSCQIQTHTTEKAALLTRTPVQI